MAHLLLSRQSPWKLRWMLWERGKEGRVGA